VTLRHGVIVKTNFNGGGLKFCGCKLKAPIGIGLLIAFVVNHRRNTFV